MSTLKIACPFCQQHLEFGHELLGGSMPCPACQKTIDLTPNDLLTVKAGPPAMPGLWPRYRRFLGVGVLVVLFVALCIASA